LDGWGNRAVGCGVEGGGGAEFVEGLGKGVSGAAASEVADFVAVAVCAGEEDAGGNGLSGEDGVGVVMGDG